MVGLEKVNRDVTDLMERVYGDRLAAIVLFGSYARGNFHEESNVDYLVALTDDEVSAMREISRIGPVKPDYYAATGITISPVAVSVNQLITSTRPFFKEARKDKKMIYERRPSYISTEC